MQDKQRNGKWPPRELGSHTRVETWPQRHTVDHTIHHKQGFHGAISKKASFWCHFSLRARRLYSSQPMC